MSKLDDDLALYTVGTFYEAGKPEATKKYLHGITILEREYVPEGEAILITKGETIQFERKGKTLEVEIKSPKGVKIVNFKPTPNNKPIRGR